MQRDSPCGFYTNFTAHDPTRLESVTHTQPAIPMKHTYNLLTSLTALPALCLMLTTTLAKETPPPVSPLPARPADAVESQAGDLLPAPKAETPAPAVPRAPTGEAKPETAARGPADAPAARARALEWLISQQRENGGWGQGGGWRQGQKGQGRVEGSEVEDPSDMGNTCMALMALIRAGHTPASGAHRDRAAKAFEFVCTGVEKADEDSMYVTLVRNSQLQSKIGAYVDTFLAGWVLSELKGTLPDKAAEDRVAKALDKVVRKISKHQKADGSFAGNAGWASVLSQGVCSRALNGAAQKGVKVDLAVLDKDQKQNTAGVNPQTGAISDVAGAATSTAGVALYSSASKVSGLWDRTRTNVKLREDAQAILKDETKSPAEKESAQKRIAQVDEEQRAAENAATAVAAKVKDKAFVAGFGNNGGEEYLSFFNLAETMRARGGEGWVQWRAEMVKIVCGAQNADGSWSGHHCITGRTFCTATALLTLVQENMPAGTPLAEKPGDKPAVDKPVTVPVATETVPAVESPAEPKVKVETEKPVLPDAK